MASKAKRNDAGPTLAAVTPAPQFTQWRLARRDLGALRARQTQQPTAPLVLRAIRSVMNDLGIYGIQKTRQSQGFKFRGIDEVMNALQPLLVKHHLIIVPRILSRSETVRMTKGGASMYAVVIDAEYDFYSTQDGSKITARTVGEAMDVSDKASNKSMAIAMKYAAFQTFCIPTEGNGDTDPDATVHGPSTPQEKPASNSGARAPAPVTREPAAAAPPAVAAARPTQTKREEPAVDQVNEALAKMAETVAAKANMQAPLDQPAGINVTTSAEVLTGVLVDLAPIYTDEALDAWTAKRKAENTRRHMTPSDGAHMDKAYRKRRDEIADLNAAKADPARDVDFEAASRDPLAGREPGQDDDALEAVA